MSVIVKLSNGTQKSVEVSDLNTKVSAFKELAADTIGIPADEQRIVFRGKILKDDDVLATVGVEHDSVMHVVRGKKSGAAPAPSTAAPASAATTTTPAPSTSAPSASTPSASASASNPYAILAQSVGGQPNAARAGATGAGAGAANPFAGMMGMNMGMGGQPGQMPQMPGGSMEDMLALMQNPLVMQQVQAMMSNPQMMEAMAQQNPSLRGMPPEMIQASLQMMSNPAMMRSMMTMMQHQQGAQGQGQGQGQGQTVGAGAGAGAGSGAAPQMPMGGANPFGSVPPGFFASPAPANPREAYRSQLEQLRNMGFPNEEANLSALVQSQGNLDFAIDRLLNS